MPAMRRRQEFSANSGEHQKAARRAFIWPNYRLISVPAIIGVHGMIASVVCIFIQAIVSRELTLINVRRLCQAWAGALLRRWFPA